MELQMSDDVHGLQILAVDDVEMNLRMMEVMLEGLGDFDFVGAHNGAEALAALEARPGIDIVLLDLEMPVMDGFETLRRIKADERTRDIPVIVITTDKGEIIRTLALGANDFMSRPYNPEELRLRVANHVHSKKLSDLARDMNEILEAEVIKKTDALREALHQSRLAEYEISLRLGRAAEFRDLDTGMHIRRVAEMSRELARLAGLPDEECELLCHASPLHDVGKIGIPDSILLKPGKLDFAEFEVMKLHTEIGGKILSDPELYPILSVGQIVAQQHHERWDGSGYPNGLSGTDIHLYGRIVTIVDIFDALSSERPYKKAFPLEEAVSFLKEKRGSFFDPELLDLFLVNLDRFTHIQDLYADGAEGPPQLMEELRHLLQAFPAEEQ
jgi:putative two-component system response regulator